MSTKQLRSWESWSASCDARKAAHCHTSAAAPRSLQLPGYWSPKERSVALMPGHHSACLCYHAFTANQFACATQLPGMPYCTTRPQRRMRKLPKGKEFPAMGAALQRRACCFTCCAARTRPPWPRRRSPARTRPPWRTGWPGSALPTCYPARALPRPATACARPAPPAPPSAPTQRPRHSPHHIILVHMPCHITLVTRHMRMQEMHMHAHIMCVFPVRTRPFSAQTRGH